MAGAHPHVRSGLSVLDRRILRALSRGELDLGGLLKDLEPEPTMLRLRHLGRGPIEAGSVFELTHADFGMSPFTYGPLTPRNQERLKSVVDVQGAVVQ